MKLGLRSLAAVALATVVTHAPSIQADLGKAVYPASMCVKWRATDVTPRLNASRIYNDSGNRTMYVDCPVPHDDAGGVFSNDNIEDLDIGVIDDSTVANARCWAIGAWQNGTTLNAVSGGTRTSSSAGLHEQNLDFAQVNGNSGSWHYIGCSIPPRQAGRQPSGLTYYKVDQ